MSTNSNRLLNSVLRRDKQQILNKSAGSSTPVFIELKQEQRSHISTDNKSVVPKLIVRDSHGKFAAEPDFLSNATYLYPIPQNLQSGVERFQLEGKVTLGEFCKVREAKKKDKRNKPIYIRYFIPSVLKKLRSRNESKSSRS